MISTQKNLARVADEQNGPGVRESLEKAVLSCKRFLFFEGVEGYTQDLGKRKISQRDTGFDRYSGSGIRQNLGTGCDAGKENGMMTEVRDAGLL